ncbi:MAG: hypothetical protein JXQ96_11700 [Cyclobacteriaceae bacterium]
MCSFKVGGFFAIFISIIAFLVFFVMVKKYFTIKSDSIVVEGVVVGGYDRRLPKITHRFIKVRYNYSKDSIVQKSPGCVGYKDDLGNLLCDTVGAFKHVRIIPDKNHKYADFWEITDDGEIKYEVSFIPLLAGMVFLSIGIIFTFFAKE